jgi:hypothetical protein
MQCNHSRAIYFFPLLRTVLLPLGLPWVSTVLRFLMFGREGLRGCMGVEYINITCKNCLGLVNELVYRRLVLEKKKKKSWE